MDYYKYQQKNNHYEPINAMNHDPQSFHVTTMNLEFSPTILNKKTPSHHPGPHEQLLPLSQLY